MIRLTTSVIMVSVCLPSDALLQHLPSYLGFSYLGRGVSLHSCSSKAQPLLLSLDEVTPPECGVAPLGRAPVSKVGAAAAFCWSSHDEIPHVQGKRNPNKTVGVVRGHQRAETLKPYSQKTNHTNHMDHNLV